MQEEGAQGGDQSYGRKRLTVDQAADQLGLSVDAVRARIKRNTIAHVREGGRVYVLLDADQGATSQDQDTAQDTAQEAGRGGHAREELIEELRDRVRYLEEESRRKDHLLAAALERIPAIESPDAPGAPETVSESEGRGASRAEQEKPSWWRRFFGLE